MEIDEQTRKSAQRYRVILNHYGCTNIARDLSDEAIYDLMYELNWLGGPDCSRYYMEYRSAEKDEEKLAQIKERYVNRTKKLLQDSGFDDKQIEEKLSQGYAEKISGLCCWAGGLQCIFRDYVGPDEVIEDYAREFEEDTKKREERIAAKQVENGGGTNDKIEEKLEYPEGPEEPDPGEPHPGKDPGEPHPGKDPGEPHPGIDPEEPEEPAPEEPDPGKDPEGPEEPDPGIDPEEPDPEEPDPGIDRSDKKLLDSELLNLLKKEETEFTEDDKMRIFELVIKHCDAFSKLDEDIKIIFSEEDRPIAQTGFEYDMDDNKFKHLITVNKSKIATFPVERIVLVACHEFVHLEDYETFIKKSNLDFNNQEDISKYIEYISRKTKTRKDWYSSRKEIEADKRGYFIAKNVYQRAVHDCDDAQLKNEFWDSYYLLDYNEKLELKKHEDFLMSAEQIGQATINTPTTAKKEAEQVENGGGTKDKIEEGEEVGDDN